MNTTPSTDQPGNINQPGSMQTGALRFTAPDIRTFRPHRRRPLAFEGQVLTFGERTFTAVSDRSRTVLEEQLQTGKLRVTVDHACLTFSAHLFRQRKNFEPPVVGAELAALEELIYPGSTARLENEPTHLLYRLPAAGPWNLQHDEQNNTEAGPADLHQLTELHMGRLLGISDLNNQDAASVSFSAVDIFLNGDISLNRAALQTRDALMTTGEGFFHLPLKAARLLTPEQAMMMAEMIREYRQEVQQELNDRQRRLAALFMRISGEPLPEVTRE